LYPSRFDYTAPTTVDEVLSILAERGDDAKVLAGGQSLIPLLKLRFAAPGILVDLNRLPGLDGVAENGRLEIGPLARHNQLARLGWLKGRYDVISQAAPSISDPLVRNLGTIGGSLAHADPQGDWASVMIALKAELVARSSRGERVIPAASFVTGTFETALEPDELLVAVRIPKAAERSGGSYLKLERKVGDFATVATAVHLELGGDGRISRAGIALTAVGPQNLGADEAERALTGNEPGPGLFDQAADLAAAAAKPATDTRGSAEYKRSVVRTFVRRGLDQALAGAQNRSET
jgi:carbon-monoxide dehydrogenase medium subunit